jgi:hypothetical protein
MFKLKKNITVKDTLPLILLKILPLASNTFIPSFLPLSESVLEVLFHEFYSCAVMAATMS